MAIVIPTLTQSLDWKDLRTSIKDCIKLVAPTAVVYSSWPLKYNIGQTVKLLQSDAYGGLVHAWMISIVSANPRQEKIGGGDVSKNLLWDLDVRIWGFVGYQETHTDNTQDVAEDEVRAITQILYMNQKNLGFGGSLKSIGLVEWGDIDTQAFGDGNDVIVAQGILSVTTSETLNI